MTVPGERYEGWFPTPEKSARQLVAMVYIGQHIPEGDIRMTTVRMAGKAWGRSRSQLWPRAVGRGLSCFDPRDRSLVRAIYPSSLWYTEVMVICRDRPRKAR